MADPRRRKKYDTRTLRGNLEWALPGLLFLPLGGVLYWLVDWVPPQPKDIVLIVVHEAVVLTWCYLWKLWPFVRFDDYPDR